MKRDSKLSGILHVLLHMAEYSTPVTSETLAGVMQTNPAVIRRIMSGLREKGYVHSEKGHGGGWRLICDLEQLTLADVWRAVGEPTLIALSNRTESPGCLIEKAVNHALDAASQEAESLLIARMEEVTLATLRQDFHRHLPANSTKVSCHE
jgi:DNA-binding IscR family transcriptional regulator